MNLTKILALVILVFGVSVSFGQKSPSKFGDINIENLQMTHTAIDSSAGAVVIFDYGISTFDHNFQIIFERHIRIKIFNSSEFDQGDVKIPYASNDRIERLKASTYNLENGEVVEYEVSKKDMYDEKVSEDLKKRRFSLPNIKEGSIIEYTYRVNYGGWQSLNPWYFQKSIPVLYSEYVVSLPEYFNYKKIMTGYIALAGTERSSKTGRYNNATFNMDVEKFIAKNVPAFKEEPFMTTNEDYISKIRFELNTINVPGSYTKTYLPASFKALSKAIAEGDYYGKSLEKNRFLKDIVAEIIGAAQQDEDKIRLIYQYVRDNFEVDMEVEAENLKKIFDLKKGYPQDLNRMLTSLLREAGYTANIVRLSTREHGRIHPIYAMASSLDYAVCIVEHDNSTYLLDASNKNLPFNVLPKKCLNGQGMVISATDFKWVDLKPNGSYKSYIMGVFELDEEGLLHGSMDIAYSDYAALNFRDKHKEDIEAFKKDFIKDKALWSLNEHTISGVEQLNEPIKVHLELEIEESAENIGNLIYMSPVVFGRMEENPLKSMERHFPVDYGMPSEETLNYRIKIPQGYKIEELPKAIAIGLPDQAGSFIYSVQELGETIIVTSKLKINRIEFATNEYAYLKEFYTQLVSKQAEQIVLKKL